MDPDRELHVGGGRVFVNPKLIRKRFVAKGKLVHYASERPDIDFVGELAGFATQSPYEFWRAVAYGSFSLFSNTAYHR